ncbi:hypothetical protein GALMADRAFT_234526 [Galerina marginata CBS 339.88]|uniref:Tyrosine specific protein phosphatases domain-containing protein n=1 Tax=Galerina marginata (strain CBS 339.88) TaxID=685588 RepID=A0A067TQV1_GALM3|nr:hypothetical protein GALMADRAFT_234526 [Galerina marginata CBS 339.88]
MSTTQIPAWLQAIKAEKRMKQILRVLSERESKRYTARNASLQHALEKSVPSPAKSITSFLPKKNVHPHHMEHYSVAVGTHQDHQNMNRYMDIIPYDRTRVVVRGGEANTGSSAHAEGVWHGRYLNANWVLERYGHKWWMAAQAPLKYTAHAFLSVMLQPVVRPPHMSTPPSGAVSPPNTSRVRTVVQLTQNVEGGRKKADPYFPGEVGRSIIVSPEEGCHTPALKVTLMETQSIEDANCIQSIVAITPLHLTSENREMPHSDEDNYGEATDSQTIIFNHLLYFSWPDHGVPEPDDRDSLIAFIRLVDRINRDTSRCSVHSNATPDHPCSEIDPDPPIMVGCSAGVGRTGSFIALSSLLRYYGFLPPAAQPTIAPDLHKSPLGPVPSDLYDDLVLQEIDSLREQRPGMVQRSEQALLVYEVLADAFAAKS